MKKDVLVSFPITTQEYEVLQTKYGRLCSHVAAKLLEKNYYNNIVDDFDDIEQKLNIQMLYAGAYTKRQIYIEKCLSVLDKYIKDGFFKMLLKELNFLWDNRTRHGANRQKFGPSQEAIMEKLVETHVPPSQRPDKLSPLEVNRKFDKYCKTIIYNGGKAMGKKITREKSIRNGQVSLSEHDYLF